MKGKGKEKTQIPVDEVAAEQEQVGTEDVLSGYFADCGIDVGSLSCEEYIQVLESSLAQYIAEYNSCKNLMQRLQADFENYRKRNLSLSEDMKALGQVIVIEKLLAVLDNCDLARKYLQDEAALTGFNMVEKQILDVLEGFGLEKIDAQDKDFDAKLMTAVERVKSQKMQGKVVEVLAQGYTIGGKLLRPASVKVGYFDGAATEPEAENDSAEASEEPAREDIARGAESELAADQEVQTETPAEQPEQTEKPEKPAKSAKAEKAEQSEKPEKSGKSGKGKK